MKIFYRKGGHSPDYVIITTFLLLVIFGLVMLASASSHLGKVRFDDSYYYLKHQLIRGLLVGILGFTAGYFIYYRRYQDWAFILLLLSLGLLLLVFTKFGIASGGAERWLRLGPITFQPAEIMKITYILYLAAWLSNSKLNRRKNLYEGFIPFLIISGMVGGILTLQPATSTVAILLGSGLVMYFLSGAPWKYVFGTISLGLLALALLVLITPYRFERVLGFLKYSSNEEGIGYHLNQSLIAIGSGQVWGVGYGQSTAKVKFLPDPIADSVFAVIGQELGFVGSATLVIVFGFLVIKIFWLAKSLRDTFGKMLLIGFGTIIAGQAFMHMAAISGIVPLTGVPLPFISFGGTALAVFMTMAGIIANISKYS
ncbi:MAG: FtsW/RodA/SpoVE family cell cycle protein [Patescibacteria group bacterium]